MHARASCSPFPGWRGGSERRDVITSSWLAMGYTFLIYFLVSKRTEANWGDIDGVRVWNIDIV